MTTPDATLDGLLDAFDEKFYAVLHEHRAATHAHVEREKRDAVDAAVGPMIQRERERMQALDAIAKELNLEWDQLQRGWWLPAEPGPVLCASIVEAVRESNRLSDNDHRRANQREAALREERDFAVAELQRVCDESGAPEPLAVAQHVRLQMATMESAIAEMHTLRAEVERLRDGITDAIAMIASAIDDDVTADETVDVLDTHLFDLLASPPPSPQTV